MSLNFQRFTELSSRCWKRRACSSGPTENQYFTRSMPSRTSMFSNSGQDRRKS